MNANEARLQFKGLREKNSYFFQENISGVGEKAAEKTGKSSSIVGR